VAWRGCRLLFSARLPLPFLRTGRDRIGVESQFSRMIEAPLHPYLENVSLPPCPAAENPRSSPAGIRIDAKGNVVFPHFDQQGLCGYEIKNRGFTGFALRDGTMKGLWSSHEEATDTRLRRSCERARIDALSPRGPSSCPEQRLRLDRWPNDPLRPELVRAAGCTDCRQTLKSSLLWMRIPKDGSWLIVVRQAVRIVGPMILSYRVNEP